MRDDEQTQLLAISIAASHDISYVEARALIDRIRKEQLLSVAQIAQRISNGQRFASSGVPIKRVTVEANRSCGAFVLVYALLLIVIVGTLFARCGPSTIAPAPSFQVSPSILRTAPLIPPVTTTPSRP
jgi:hypothetical protein